MPRILDLTNPEDREIYNRLKTQHPLDLWTIPASRKRKHYTAPPKPRDNTRRP
jgi:hypothetical protein